MPEDGVIIEQPRALEPLEDLERRVQEQDKLPQEVVGLNEFWEKLDPFVLALAINGGYPIEGSGLDRQTIETMFGLESLRKLAGDPQRVYPTGISDKGWRRTSLDPLGAHARVYLQPERENVTGDLMLTFINGAQERLEVSSTFPTNPCKKLQFTFNQDSESYTFKATIDTGGEQKVVTGESKQADKQSAATWSIQNTVGKKG